MQYMKYDLLSMVDQGGCSAKLSAAELNRVLRDLPVMKDDHLLVNISTHDDAGVYKIREDYALIQTTDFFPPVCSDGYDFGQVSAANAMSDVYAMGGQVLTALNLVMFPPKLPLEILKDILRGGQEKVAEAGGVIAGGHTIADDIPKYGLAVTGWVDPENLVTNDQAKEGDVLILTKPIGTGVIIAAKKNGLCREETYQIAVESMKLLNNEAARVMNDHRIRCATDITGFSLLGHAFNIASASRMTLRIHASDVPALPEVHDLIELGCIPGAAFRNLDFVEKECACAPDLGYNSKMFLVDAQTSGGILMACPGKYADLVLEELKNGRYPESSVIGEVMEQGARPLIVEA